MRIWRIAASDNNKLKILGPAYEDIKGLLSNETFSDIHMADFNRGLSEAQIDFLDEIAVCITDDDSDEPKLICATDSLGLLLDALEVGADQVNDLVFEEMSSEDIIKDPSLLDEIENQTKDLLDIIKAIKVIANLRHNLAVDRGEY